MSYGSWYFRINNGEPKSLSLKKYDDVDEKVTSTWAYQAKFEPKKAKKITVYYDGKMKAHEMFQISIHSSMFKKIKCGTLDCTVSTTTFKIPDVFKYCKDSLTAKIRVKEIKPPLAYETAGKQFDKFLEEISSIWRKHAMNYVKSGIMAKKVDENVAVSSENMRTVTQALLKHCSTKMIVSEFESSFKSLKI